MKAHPRVVLFSLLILAAPVLAGCAQQPEPIDLEAAKAALMEVDRAWSETPPNADAFTAFAAEGAYFLNPEAPQAVGKEQIREAISQLFSAPGLALQWKASSAEVSSSGDLGYTLGTFELTVNDAGGHPVTREGKYTTIWRKQADGSWKMVVDAPNFNSPAPAAAPAAEE